MHRYHKLGEMPKKRHTVFRDKNGKIYHEELKGNKGFVGFSTEKCPNLQGTSARIIP